MQHIPIWFGRDHERALGGSPLGQMRQISLRLSPAGLPIGLEMGSRKEGLCLLYSHPHTIRHIYLGQRNAMVTGNCCHGPLRLVENVEVIPARQTQISLLESMPLPHQDILQTASYHTKSKRATLQNGNQSYLKNTMARGWHMKATLVFIKLMKRFFCSATAELISFKADTNFLLKNTEQRVCPEK